MLFNSNMSGIKCLNVIMRSAPRITFQMQNKVSRNVANFSSKIDILAQSKRKLCVMAGFTWNADALNTSLAKKYVTKLSCSSPITIGYLSAIKPLLIDPSACSSSDMLECLDIDEDGDTWSYI